MDRLRLLGGSVIEWNRAVRLVKGKLRAVRPMVGE